MGNEAVDRDGGTPEPMFITYSPEEDPQRKAIGVLLEDAQGKLWCGTGDGLYWFEERNNDGVFHRVDLPKQRPNMNLEVSAIIQDQRGNVWIGLDSGQGLNRITLSGHIDHFAIINEGQSKGIKTLLETKEGEIWAGTSDGGLYSLVSDPVSGRPILA
jgi:ligand-binding sensor domain-containing protein